MKTTRRIISGIVMASALACSGLVAFAFVPTLMGYEAHIITSGSMGSAAPIGSVALTRMATPASVGTGDIVVFRHPSAAMTFTHRVIERTIDGTVFTFRTKGDANGAPDPEEIRTTEQIARVARVVPYAGRIVTFARSPIGLILFLLVPAVGLATGGRRGGRRRPRVPASSGGAVLTWTVALSPPASTETPFAGVWPALALSTGTEFGSVS